MGPHHQTSALGAVVTPSGTRFTVWAPAASRVDVVIDGSDDAHPLASGENGYFSAEVAGIGAGTRYRYRLDGGDAIPDPCSRFQPEGVHGLSEVIDSASFQWSDAEWPGIDLRNQIIYELHVGTYSEAGTFDGVTAQLETLRDLGVTVIEIMPVAAFPGRWNWGYDGVALFAPTENYGRPDDFRRLVDTAHRLGLAVILDAVYNHLGPDGNYLRLFSPDYFTDKHETPWGEAVNYDDANSRQVRDFAIANACMWIREYHLDGLRLDATDSIKDDSEPHILQELTAAVRAAAGERSVVVIAEDARNDVQIIRPVEQGGYGLDAVWADDFHHAVRVALTGLRENYYAGFLGAPGEITRAIGEGFIYQGQAWPETDEPRGTEVTDEAATSFVFCIQNHDQVGNRPFGDRLHHHIDHGRYHAASALLLFAPETPLLFMGQEFSSSAPFLFFTDHHDELGQLVTEGRRNEFSGFAAFTHEDLQGLIPDPQHPDTFRLSRLDPAERERHAGIYRWYQDLIAFRRTDPVLTVQDRAGTVAESHGYSTILVRRSHAGQTRLLIANFGHTTTMPLPAAGAGQTWHTLFDSNDPRYGGVDRQYEIDGDTISIPARSSAVLKTSDK
jgi:maltooligosyltrehalose trehalohydrolase